MPTSRHSGAARSRSRTGCSGASSRRRTSSRRRSSASIGYARPGEKIDSPPAYVATIATRLAIDHLRSARVRREQYVGDWLPGAARRSRRGRSGPARRDGRVALGGVPGCARAPVAGATGRAPPARRLRLRLSTRSPRSSTGRSGSVRQLAVRARRRRARGAPAIRGLAPPARAAGVDLLRGRRRTATSRRSRPSSTEDVVLRGDGGGKAPAIGHSIVGRADVARTLMAWARHGRALRRLDSTRDGQRRPRRPCAWIRTGGCSPSGRSTSPMARSAASPPSSTRTSCATSRPSGRWATPCAAFATRLSGGWSVMPPLDAPARCRRSRCSGHPRPHRTVAAEAIEEGLTMVRYVANSQASRSARGSAVTSHGRHHRRSRSSAGTRRSAIGTPPRDRFPHVREVSSPPRDARQSWLRDARRRNGADYLGVRTANGRLDAVAVDQQCCATAIARCLGLSSHVA